MPCLAGVACNSEQLQLAAVEHVHCLAGCTRWAQGPMVCAEKLHSTSLNACWPGTHMAHPCSCPAASNLAGPNRSGHSHWGQPCGCRRPLSWRPQEGLQRRTQEGQVPGGRLHGRRIRPEDIQPQISHLVSRLAMRRCRGTVGLQPRLPDAAALAAAYRASQWPRGRSRRLAHSSPGALVPCPPAVYPPTMCPHADSAAACRAPPTKFFQLRSKDHFAADEFWREGVLVRFCCSCQ